MGDTQVFYRERSDALKTALLFNAGETFDRERYRTLVASTLDSLTILVPVFLTIFSNMLS